MYQYLYNGLHYLAASRSKLALELTAEMYLLSLTENY